MINIQKDQLVKEVSSRILAKVLDKLPGMEGKAPNLKVNSIILKDLEFSLENIQEFNEVGIILRSLQSSVESRVFNFMAHRSSVPAIENLTDLECMTRGMFAYENEQEDDDEDEDPDVFANDEESLEDNVENQETGIAIMVAELIKEVVSADASEVNEIAEKIITLSKDEADINKDADLDDEDIFATNDKTDEDEDDDDDNDDGDSNPFDDDEDDSKGDDKKSKKDDKKKDDKKKEEPDNEDKKKGSNPFDEDDDSEDDNDKDVKDKKNVFDDDDDDNDDDETSGKTRGEENHRTKHISKIKLSTFGLEKLMNGYEEFNPFIGLENKSFNTYSKFMADSTFGDTLHSVYTEHGLESEQFKVTKDKYSTLAKSVHGAAIAVVLLSSLVGSDINTNKIKSPATFIV